MVKRIKCDRPIFEIGCGKSGTTLLSLLLSMHPAVGPAAPDMEGSTPQDYLNAMLIEHLFEPVAHRIERKDVWDRYLPVDVPLRIGAELILYSNPLDPERTDRLIADLLADFDKPRFLGKQPFNTFRVHVLREIFPDCKLVAIHRDGRDVIGAWGRKADRWQVFGGYRTAIEVFARKWNEAVDHIEAYKAELDILTLRYEDLVTDLPGEMRRVLAHCELDYLPEIYDKLVLRSQIGRWIELIPAQHHQRCNDLTARNRSRLAYEGDEFALPVTYSRVVDKNASFANYYLTEPKAMVPCPLCEGRQFETLSQADRHDVGLCTAMCMQCGLIMNNPRPGADWYADFYANWFWPLYIGKAAASMEQLFEDDLCARKGELIGRLILKEFDAPVAHFLDLGCGLGGLLGFFEKNRPAWRISGFDPSAEAVAFVRGRSGANVRQVTLTDLPQSDERYNVISIVHVLEHVLEPVDLLATAARMLAPGGILYLEVPDFFSPNWRGAEFLHVAHCYLFDADTLTTMLERAGLTAVRFVQSPVQEHWSWAIGVFARVNSNGAISASGVGQITESERSQRRNWMSSRLAAKRNQGVFGPFRAIAAAGRHSKHRTWRAMRAAWRELSSP